MLQIVAWIGNGFCVWNQLTRLVSNGQVICIVDLVCWKRGHHSNRSPYGTIWLCIRQCSESWKWSAFIHASRIALWLFRFRFVSLSLIHLHIHSISYSLGYLLSFSIMQVSWILGKNAYMNWNMHWIQCRDTNGGSKMEWEVMETVPLIA